jgi:signal transduction histidine kinase
MLRDITEQKQSQARILQQQRVLATQAERERMARELHDSLGQVLSYASLQVETAEQLSLEGQGEAAAAQLNRLGSVVRDAHADLREYILNLHATSSLEQPFFPTVKQYLDSFTRSYNIVTRLDVGPGLEQREFPPEMKLQLFRILQEATSNARKHGRSHHVQVMFRTAGGHLRMTIQDDGCGFTPEEAAPSGGVPSAKSPDGGAHYGLEFMRERAGTLGGSLQINSEPGSGTRVELTIPIKEE